MVFKLDPKSVLDHAAKEIAREDHTVDPKQAPDQAVSEKGRIPHFGRSDDKRCEGADDRNETCEDHRFRSVLLKKSMGLFNATRFENIRVLSIEKLFSHRAAGPVTCAIAEKRPKKECN